jgi:hypothetical protein
MVLCSNDPDTQALIDESERPHRHRCFFDAEQYLTHGCAPTSSASVCQQHSVIVPGFRELFLRGGTLD